MPDKRLAYIIYSHDDTDPDVVSFIRDRLAEDTRGFAEVASDSNIPLGGDIRESLAQLERADVVIPILTPGFAEKARAGAGPVGQEFKLLVERHRRAQRESREPEGSGSETLLIVPVLMHSNAELSRLPEPFAHFKWVDLTDTVRKNKQDVVQIVARSRFNTKIERVLSAIRTISTTNTVDFQREERELQEKLFVNLKDDGNLDQELFVRTRPYERVRDQQVFLLIGRKGSGKSTVTSFLTRTPDKLYKGAFDINVDHVNLETLFAQISEEQIRSDTQHVVSLEAVFELAWRLFLHTCAMLVITSPDTRERLDDEQRRHLGVLDEALNDIIRNREEAEDLTPVLLTYCLGKVIELLKTSISSASTKDDSHFQADIIGSFTFSELSRISFRGDAAAALDQVLRRCDRPILITLDGFDTAYNAYRDASVHVYSDRIADRTRVEVEWLRALLSVALTAKQKGSGNSSALNPLLDFCLTVPKDRFLEILHHERDSYRYRDRFSELNWSGIELSILLRKRLERLCGLVSAKDLAPLDRLAFALNGACPRLPQELEIEHNGSIVRLPTFVYVLRHTFFRPRDVLFYYAKLIALSRNWERRRLGTPSSEDVRRTIKTAAFAVIRDEFVNEFKGAIVNLADVMECFRDSPLTLSAEQVEDRIGPIPFRLAQSSEKLTSLSDKVKLLVSIGFLGVSLSEDWRRGFGFKNRDVFSFTELRVVDESDEIIKGILEARFGDSKFLIHPVFLQRLTLQNPDAFDVFRLSWDYLRNTDAMVDA